MKIVIVGATGLVGSEMLKVLSESSLVVEALIPVASEKSKGKSIVFKGKSFPIVSLLEALEQNPNIAIFSAGGSVSKVWAPKFAEKKCYVIDNSSAWRMDNNCPLVVPEINADVIKQNHYIIANPNCSTIQMVLALSGLHKKYGIERLVISTYQSVTGTGVEAVNQMEGERKGEKPNMVYPYPIDLNCLPHGGDFLPNAYTTEEMKLVYETQKILNDKDIKITATVVRVPVYGGHSESVNVAFKKPFDMQECLGILHSTPGIVVQDDIKNNIYPMPLYSKGKNEVFVGRLRRDESIENGLNMWIVADNLRKGAATNAVQIAEKLVEKFH